MKSRDPILIWIATIMSLWAGPLAIKALPFLGDPRIPHGFRQKWTFSITFSIGPRGGSSADTLEKESSVILTNTSTLEEDTYKESAKSDSNTATLFESEEEEYPKRYNFPLCQPGDGSETDPDGIPGRFLRMQKGNREKAKACFQHTLQWRAEHEVDTVLERPHAKFHVCKAVFPHYFCGRDPSGHVVFVQRPGCINMQLAKLNHISTQDLLQHYVYILEYCWNIVEPRPDQTMTSVIDLKGIHFGSVMEMIAFVKQFVGMMSVNYPQRSHKTLLINSPRWFGTVYRLISPLLRESTRKKIEIHHRGKKQDEAVRTYLGDLTPQQLLSRPPKPSDDTSEGDVGTGEDSPMERDLRAFCMARLQEAGQDMQVLIS